MFKKILLGCFGFVLLSCYEVKRDCKDYKTGTFKFDYLENGLKKTARFKRTDSLSIDYIEGKPDTSSVRWINDCEFILKKTHPTTMQEQKAIHMKILSTTDSSYIFEFKYALPSSNAPNQPIKGVAVKIN